MRMKRHRGDEMSPEQKHAQNEQNRMRMKRRCSDEISDQRHNMSPEHKKISKGEKARQMAKHVT